MRKYHPWIEEINHCILLLEESGIFMAWADKELRIDVTKNPNREEANLTVKFDIGTLTSMITILAVGLFITTIVFVFEKLTKRRFLEKCKLKLKLHHKNSWMNLVLLILCTSLIRTFFQDEENYPEVICKFPANHKILI